jgi:hypothetical protein
MLASMDDRSMQSKDPSSTAHRKRGRPKRQISAIETDHLEIEPKRRLRSKIPVGAATDDDPWVTLSKGPSITSLSSNIPHRVATMQKLVKHPHFVPITVFSDHLF